MLNPILCTRSKGRDYDFISIIHLTLVQFSHYKCLKVYINHRLNIQLAEIAAWAYLKLLRAVWWSSYSTYNI